MCVVDLTESSAKVLEMAARISKACNGQLLVLFPYRLIDYGYRGDMASLKLKLETEAKGKFNELKKNLADMEDLPCEFQAEIGFLADRINAHVKRNTIDMVIVGQKQAASTNDIRDFNLQSLITNSRLPFMIVPAEVNAETRV